MEKINSFSDKKKSIYNITVSITLKVILFVFSFWVRRTLINILGNEYNGINSLFLNILGILSIAELGIGTAVTFCMYKPIVENDVEKVSGLYNLLKKVYFIISIIVLAVGVICALFLSILAKDYTIGNIELYSYYFLFLLSSILTYYCGAQAALINAYKNNFIANLFYSISIIAQYLLQILVLYLFKSFYLYLAVKSICVGIQYILQKIYCKKYYGEIINHKVKVDEESKKAVKDNVSALFLHQITAKIFSSVDGLVISSMFGVIILGKYSNYFLILNSMNEILKLVFTSIISIIGQLIIKKNKSEIFDIYHFLNNVNIIIGFVFYLGYYAIVNDIITLVLGNDLILSDWIVILVTCTYYLQFERQACANMKDAAGLYQKDKYIVLIAALLNVILSICFAYVLDIYGVIFATLILVALIYHPVDSFILHKYLFEMRCYKDLAYKFVSFIVFIGAIFLMRFVRIPMDNVFIDLLVNGCISVGISIVCVLALQVKDVRFNIRCLQKFKNR